MSKFNKKLINKNRKSDLTFSRGSGKISKNGNKRKRENMSAFSERLNELINSSGLMKKDIANDVGITPGELTKYLSGDRKPGMEVLCSLGTALNVSVDYLLGKETDQSTGMEECVETLTRNKNILSKDDKIKLVSILMRHIDNETK